MTLPHLAAGRRNVLQLATRATCFYCLAWFDVLDIEDWTDFSDEYPDGATAICPRCGTDAVIGEASGVDTSVKGLRKLHNRWFVRPSPIPS